MLTVKVRGPDCGQLYSVDHITMADPDQTSLRIVKDTEADINDEEDGGGGGSNKHTYAQQFSMLTVFMLPLVITQVVPDLAEQVSLPEHYVQMHLVCLTEIIYTN